MKHYDLATEMQLKSQPKAIVTSHFSRLTFGTFYLWPSAPCLSSVLFVPVSLGLSKQLLSVPFGDPFLPRVQNNQGILRAALGERNRLQMPNHLFRQVAISNQKHRSITQKRNYITSTHIFSPSNNRIGATAFSPRGSCAIVTSRNLLDSNSS